MPTPDAESLMYPITCTSHGRSGYRATLITLRPGTVVTASPSVLFPAPQRPQFAVREAPDTGRPVRKSVTTKRIVASSGYTVMFAQVTSYGCVEMIATA